MNRLTRSAATLIVITGISLVLGSTTAIPAATSAGRPGAPQVFHCC
jgi:hypothetical protein